MAKIRANVYTAEAKATSGGYQTGKPQEAAVRPEPKNDEATAALAYAFWLQRGCPVGTPEEDWFRAEEEMRNRKVLTAHGARGQ